MANLANFCNSEKSVKLFRIWWTRGDSNPRPPRCERGITKAKTRRHNHLAIFTGPLIGKSGKPVFSLSFQCSSMMRSRIKSRTLPVPDNDDRVISESPLDKSGASFSRSRASSCMHVPCYEAFPYLADSKVARVFGNHRCLVSA